MMCALGRHQLHDDIPAPKRRARPRRARQSRQDLEAAQINTRQQLEIETGHTDPGLAAAQEQFALNFEALPPGMEQVSDDEPAKQPWWV